MLSVASISPTMAQMGSFREPLRPRILLCRDRLPFLRLGWKTAVLREKASRGWFARETLTSFVRARNVLKFRDLISLWAQCLALLAFCPPFLNLWAHVSLCSPSAHPSSVCSSMRADTFHSSFIQQPGAWEDTQKLL